MTRAAARVQGLVHYKEHKNNIRNNNSIYFSTIAFSPKNLTQTPQFQPIIMLNQNQNYNNTIIER